MEPGRDTVGGLRDARHKLRREEDEEDEGDDEGGRRLPSQAPQFLLLVLHHRPRGGGSNGAVVTRRRTGSAAAHVYHVGDNEGMYRDERDDRRHRVDDDVALVQPLARLGELEQRRADGPAGDADHAHGQADVQEDGGAGDGGAHERDLCAERRAGGEAPRAAAAHGDEPVDAEADGVPHGEEGRQRAHELDELAPAADAVEVHVQVVRHPRVQDRQQTHGVDDA